MDKKGQITIFIIIGIILLFIFLFILYIAGVGVEREVEVPVEYQPLKIYTESCLESTAVSAIQLAGIQGGFTDIPYLALITDYSTIAYHYHNGNITTPTREVIESQISSFITNALEVCLDEFSSFKEQGYDVTTGDISTETIIREDDVFIRIDYPIDLARANSRIRLDKYSAIVPIRLGHVYDISQLVTAKTTSDPEWIDMTFLSGFDVKIDVLPYDEEKFVYSISDPLSLIEGEPFVFLFANSFIVNKAPVLDIPDVLTFKDGEAVVFQIEATDPEGDPLTFSDDTAMFDITEDGVILFMPEVTGEFDVMITVEDTHENKVSKIVRFVIE